MPVIGDRPFFTGKLNMAVCVSIDFRCIRLVFRSMQVQMRQCAAYGSTDVQLKDYGRTYHR